MKIVWDEPKRQANLEKHGLDFADLDETFFDTALVIPSHNKSKRWVAIGVSLVWLGYGLYGGGAVQVALNGTTLVLNGLLLVRLVPGRRHAVAGLLGTLLAATAVWWVGSTAGLLPLGVIGAAVGTVVYLPQLLALRTAHHVDGVSAASLWLQGVSGSCWIGYGVLRSEVVVWTPNVFVLLTTALSLLLLRSRRTPVAVR